MIRYTLLIFIFILLPNVYTVQNNKRVSFMSLLFFSNTRYNIRFCAFARFCLVRPDLYCVFIQWF